MKIKNFIKKLCIGLSVLGCAVGITSITSNAYTMPSDSFQGIGRDVVLRHSFEHTNDDAENYVFIYQIYGTYNNLSLNFNCDFLATTVQSVVANVSVGFTDYDWYNSNLNTNTNFLTCSSVESTSYSYIYDNVANTSTNRSLDLLGDFNNPLNYSYLYLIFSGTIYRQPNDNYINSFEIGQLSLSYGLVPYGAVSGDISSLTNQVSQLTNQNATLQTENDTLRVNNSRLNSQIYSLNNQINDLNNTISGLQSDVQSLQNSLNNIIDYDFNLGDLLFSIGAIPFASFSQIWNVDFLGFNIAQAITGFITLLIIFAIIRIFLIGK